MLNQKSVMTPPGNVQRGFSLIELMVALVVGLIVSGAAIGFVVAVAKSNSENIQVTRLTQELRSVSEVITKEIRRARFVVDPIGNVAQGGAGSSVRDPVRASNPDSGNAYYQCLTLHYDNPSTDSSAPQPDRTIYWNDVDGRVYLANGTTCSGGEAISSAQIKITLLAFDDDTDPGNLLPPLDMVDPTKSNIGNFVRIRVAGKLAAATGDMASVTRTFQQDTYIRSGKVE